MVGGDGAAAVGLAGGSVAQRMGEKMQWSKVCKPVRWACMRTKDRKRIAFEAR
jgi:hypothetical protein